MAVTRFLHPNVDVAIHHDTDTENTAVTLEESPVLIHSLDIDNSANGSPSYVKLYDSVATIVVGTTVPDYVFMVPASLRMIIESPDGLNFANGCQIATVTAGGTAGSTSPSSAVILAVTYNVETEDE